LLRGIAKTAPLLLVGFAFFAAPAGAVTIADSQTELALTPGLYAQLKANDVQIRPFRPAAVDHRFVTLPVSSGNLEATYGSGYLFYDGGIRLRVRNRKVELRRLVLNTTKRWLRGKVGGRELTIATVQGTRAGWEGFDIGVTLDLRLTGRAASLLNRRLGLDGVLRAGRPLAVADTLLRPETVGVTGGTIELTFDPGFRAKLESLEVEIRTAEEGTLAGSPPQLLALPISLGSISPDLSRGILISEGGFALQREGSAPGWARFIALSVSPESHRLGAAINVPTGVLNANQLATVDFTGVPAMADPASGSIAAAGATAVLDATVAAALNDIFATPLGKAPVFSGGEPLGAISFSARTR
jgi:hypothetical protein